MTWGVVHVSRYDDVDVELLLDATARNLAAVRELLVANPAGESRSCPDWTVADVAEHMGAGVGRGYYRILSTPAEEITMESLTETASGREEGQSDLAYFDENVSRWNRLIEDLDPAVERLGLSRPVPGSYWIQRAALETTIHLWDAETATGQHSAIGSEVSCYGIEEVLYDIFTLGLQVGLAAPRLPLEVMATDLDEKWRVCVEGDRTALSGCAEPAASISAAADVLLLLLWGRTHFDSVTSDGPPELIETWLGLAAFSQNPG